MYSMLCHVYSHMPCQISVLTVCGTCPYGLHNIEPFGFNTVLKFHVMVLGVPNCLSFIHDVIIIFIVN